MSIDFIGAPAHGPRGSRRSGAIGRRYRRQDEIGTPFCITVDFETLGEKDPALRETVTLRDRDTMKQERVAIQHLRAILRDRIA